MVDSKNPEQMFLRCAGSLGWAFPAAMGAKCAVPDRPVMCFTGDGGFWYHLSELETAARYGINTLTVVNNNHSLNQEKRGNERYYQVEPEMGSLGGDVDTFEGERLTLGTHETVAALIVREPILVVRMTSRLPL